MKISDLKLKQRQSSHDFLSSNIHKVPDLSHMLHFDCECAIGRASSAKVGCFAHKEGIEFERVHSFPSIGSLP